MDPVTTENNSPDGSDRGPADSPGTATTPEDRLKRAIATRTIAEETIGAALARICLAGDRLPSVFDEPGLARASAEIQKWSLGHRHQALGNLCDLGLLVAVSGTAGARGATYTMLPGLRGLSGDQILDLVMAQFPGTGDEATAIGWRFKLKPEEAASKKEQIKAWVQLLRSGESVRELAAPTEAVIPGGLRIKRGTFVIDSDGRSGRVKFISAEDGVLVEDSESRRKYRRYLPDAVAGLHFFPDLKDASSFTPARLLEQEKLVREFGPEGHIQPAAYERCRALRASVEKGELLSPADFAFLEHHAEMTRQRYESRGEALAGLSIWQIVFMDRLMNGGGNGARMIADAPAIAERFGREAFSTFVRDHFDGREIKPSIVGDYARQLLEYFDARTDSSRIPSYTRRMELVAKVSAIVAKDVSIIEQLADSLTLLPTPAPDRAARVLRRTERQDLLSARVSRQLHDSLFQHEISPLLAHRLQSYGSAPQARQEVVAELRRRWEEGRPVHMFRTRREDQVLVDKALNDRVFRDWPTALHAAGIPKYFIREGTSTHNASPMDQRRFLREFRALIGPDGTIDCERLAGSDNRSLFVSAYYYYPTLLAAARAALGDPNALVRVPELPPLLDSDAITAIARKARVDLGPTTASLEREGIQVDRPPGQPVTIAITGSDGPEATDSEPPVRLRVGGAPSNPEILAAVLQDPRLPVPFRERLVRAHFDPGFPSFFTGTGARPPSPA